MVIADPPYAAVERRTAAQEAIAQIRNFVANGTLPPGARLPSERELSERLGVSRPTLREAVRALVALGVLESRSGSGTFVTDLSAGLLAAPFSFVLDANRHAIGDLFAVRLPLELAATEAAAPRMCPDVLERLAATVEDMGRNIDDISAHVDADIAFHRIIHETSGNAVLLALMRMLAELDRHSRLVMSRRREACVSAVTAHEQIVAAFRGGTPAACVEAMREHLQSCWAGGAQDVLHAELDDSRP